MNWRSSYHQLVVFSMLSMLIFYSIDVSGKFAFFFILLQWFFFLGWVVKEHLSNNQEFNHLSSTMSILLKKMNGKKKLKRSKSYTYIQYLIIAIIRDKLIVSGTQLFVLKPKLLAQTNSVYRSVNLIFQKVNLKK